MRGRFAGAAALAVLALAALAARAAEITALPGFGAALPSRQFSGFVTLGGAAGSKHMHYWLVESERDAATAPLFVWMNGGPGCSSLEGLTRELGPWRVAANLSLSLNPARWTQDVNVVFIESPVGVGFSYGDQPSDYYTDDLVSARDNLAFIIGFYQQFPQFAKNPLYLSGESYAGFYVPLFAKQIHDHNAAGASPYVPLKGYMVGNGVTQWDFDLNGNVDYLWNHAQFSAAEWAAIEAGCPNGNYQSTAPACQNALNAAYKTQGSVNPYDIIGPCGNYIPSGDLGERELRRTSKAYNMLHDNAFVASGLRTLLGGSPPCDDTKYVAEYFNSEDVRKAIFVDVPALGHLTWSICSDVLHYNIVLSSVIDIHKELMHDYDVLVFSGDADSVISYVGTQRWLNSLNLPVKAARRPWYYPDPHYGQQVGGGVVEWYDITFATVRGAGHMVPEYRPDAALQMLRNFLSGKW